MTKHLIGFNAASARGFTLLEVLVALAIFALISVTCYRQVDASFRSATRIEQKYIALWIAENQLEEAFIERRWPLAGETSSDIEMASQKWLVKLNVSETDIKDLRKMQVSVYVKDDDTETSVLTMTRFIGKN